MKKSIIFLINSIILSRYEKIYIDFFTKTFDIPKEQLIACKFKNFDNII